MKNLLIALFAILGALNFNCSKIDIDNLEEINSSTCYKGKILKRECPSFAYIQIESHNVGENWNFNGVNYENIIGISNLPDSISSNTIYLTINTKADYKDCIEQTPCQFPYIPAKQPSNMYCLLSISEIKCHDYEN